VPKWHHYARLLNSTFHKGEAMLDTTKERISSRVPKPVRKMLEEAAALSGATLNQFVVQAALKEAHAVLETRRVLEPGVVERHSGYDRSWFAVGALSEATKGRVKEIAELLSFVGTVEISENIRAAKWMKLVSNACTLVPTGIIGLPLVEANAIPEMRAFMLASGQEALRVRHRIVRAV